MTADTSPIDELKPSMVIMHFFYAARIVLTERENCFLRKGLNMAWSGTDSTAYESGALLLEAIGCLS